MLLVVDFHITEQLLCMCMKSSYQECTAHYLYVFIGHMTLKQTRNSLLYMTVCICSELYDHRDSSTALLELQNFAQPRLEVTNKRFYL